MFRNSACFRIVRNLAVSTRLRYSWAALATLRWSSESTIEERVILSSECILNDKDDIREWKYISIESQDRFRSFVLWKSRFEMSRCWGATRKRTERWSNDFCWSSPLAPTTGLPCSGRRNPGRAPSPTSSYVTGARKGDKPSLLLASGVMPRLWWVGILGLEAGWLYYYAMGLKGRL